MFTEGFLGDMICLRLAMVLGLNYSPLFPIFIQLLSQHRLKQSFQSRPYAI